MTVTRSRDAAPLLLLLVLALAFRVIAILRFPVVFDEVDVMAYGLARALHVEGEGGRLLFDTPFSVSNGITPLWFWLQAIPAAVFGATTKIGLRTVPVALGLVGTALAYRAGMQVAGRRAAFLSGLVYAAGDVFVYTTARGEFAESLLAPLAMMLLLDLRPAPGSVRLPIRSACWPALALLAYLGKGLLLLAGYLAVLALLWLLGRVDRVEAKVSLTRLGLCALLAVAPTVLYLAAAQQALFAGGRARVTDLGPAASVWQNVHGVTLGYGGAAKAFMVSRWHDALYVYRDARAWPTLALLAFPCGFALAALAVQLARGLAARDRRRTQDALVPLCLVAPAAAVVVGQGVLDARFHLLYLPVLLPYAAAGVERWLALLEQRRPAAYAALGLAGAVPALLTFARAPRPGIGGEAGTAFLAAAALLAAPALFARARPRLASRWALAAWCAIVATALLWAGPLHWGRHWAWEPGPIAADRPREVTTFPAVELQLGLRALARDGAGGARPFLVAALDRHPEDPATLREAGTLLLDAGPRDAEVVIRALTPYVRRHPEDDAVRAVLLRALDLTRRAPAR